jgi:transcriptional pleiotropic regulator of transition state genes
MKNTGIIRKVDELGRIVVPKEMRTALEIKEGDRTEISLEGNAIVIKKYEDACVFSKSTNGLTDFGDKKICQGCLNALKKI